MRVAAIVALAFVVAGLVALPPRVSCPDCAGLDFSEGLLVNGYATEGIVADISWGSGSGVATLSAGPHTVTLDDDGSVVWAGDGLDIGPPPPSAGATIDPADIVDGTYHPCEDLEQIVRELAKEVRALRESVEALSPTTARVVVIAGD